ncbi:MAG: hypothetical protein ACKV2O_05355 [Acidimicrobiales bacterium]
MMRSVLCDEQAFAELIGEGALYDYELGERYIVAPAASFEHGKKQSIIIHVLLNHFVEVSAPANLGVLGEPGQRWYVVPGVVVAPEDTTGGDALLDAVIAVEICSPREDPAAKLAAYREVMARTGLHVGEVWYVDGATVSVHPDAAEHGPTAHPAALAAVEAALRM